VDLSSSVLSSQELLDAAGVCVKPNYRNVRLRKCQSNRKSNITKAYYSYPACMIQSKNPISYHRALKPEIPRKLIVYRCGLSGLPHGTRVIRCRYIAYQPDLDPQDKHCSPPDRRDEVLRRIAPLVREKQSLSSLFLRSRSSKRLRAMSRRPTHLISCCNMSRRCAPAGST
jgi:hypothetical protein